VCNVKNENMVAQEREYNSREKMISRLKELISELNKFTLEVEHWKINDIDFSIQIKESPKKERRFVARLIEVTETVI
jgi:hypothetical protein